MRAKYPFLARTVMLLCAVLMTMTAWGGATYVINSSNFHNYFDENGYLKDDIPVQSTLNFQGEFVGQEYSVYINKRVTITSSDKSAVFKTNVDASKILKFNIVAGADNTVIKDLKFVNCDLFITGSTYVTVDGIDMYVNKTGVGSGTGFLSIHSGATYATVKNSHFENAGNGGSSCLVAGKGGAHATFDHNTFDITGASGHVMSGNIYVTGSSGDAPEYVTYTNNVINVEIDAIGLTGISVYGKGNVVENNTIKYAGNAISSTGTVPTSASEKNVYRNNTITNGGTMSVPAYSDVQNNTIYGNLTINGNGNTIKDNTIVSTGDYAVDLKNTSNNDVQNNLLWSSAQMSNAAVKQGTGSGNTVANNTSGTQITSSEGNVTFNSGGWYYVSGDITINGELYFSTTTDDVNIILCDNAKLVINTGSTPRGICYNKALNIYAQSMGDEMGRLEINGDGNAIESRYATCALTINGGSIHLKGNPDNVIYYGINVPTITINGGNITIENHDNSITASQALISTAFPGSLTINGGTITADNVISTYNLTINGGQVTTSNMIGHDNVIINGGQVTATGNNGITAGNNITLNWTNATDFIESPKYSADGISASKPFKYDGAAISVGTVAASEINGKKLVPNPAAKIGETLYATFAEALNNVAYAKTITLLNDVDESGATRNFSNHSITLDLNDHTATIGAISGDVSLNIKNGTLTLPTIANTTNGSNQTLTIDNANVTVTSHLQWEARRMVIKNNATLEVQTQATLGKNNSNEVITIDETSQMKLTDCVLSGTDKAETLLNNYVPHGKSLEFDGMTENNLILRNYSDYLALVDNMGNRGGVVTYYDFGITAPTAETFDPAKPGTDLTPYGNNILPGHYVVMDINVNPYTWTDAELLSCQETNGGTTVSDSHAVTLLARKIGTYTYSSGTFTYYDGKGWYCYQVPAANTVAAGYTQSELNGDVVDVFDLDEKNNITQNGKMVTVTDGTDGGWSAVLTVDEVSYKFDGNKHQPKYTSIVIKKGDVTKITLTDATFIGELLHELNKGTTIDRYYLDIWSKSNYGWFSGDCWDRTVAGFDITVPLSTAKSYDANDPTTILGCETNPWLITSATELNLLAKCVNIGRYTFEGEYLQVTEDIDMSEIDDFLPIGTNASFCGTFDGNSKTISNLSLVLAPDNDEEEDDMDPIPVGLFGEVGYVKYEWDDETPAETPVPAVVKNFTLQDCTFNDGGYSLWTGGVAGKVKKGSTISGVTLKGCTIQSSAFPQIMPIDDVLGYVVPRVGGVAGESVGLIENCTVEDCTISSQVTKLEPVPSDEEMHLDAPTQWNVVGGIVGTTIKSTEEMAELEVQAKRRAPAQQPVSESRRRLRGNPIELGLTGNRVKGATTITSDIAGDVVSPVGAIFGELEEGTVLSDNKYGLNVKVTRKKGMGADVTTVSAEKYQLRGYWREDLNIPQWDDINDDTEGAMLEVYPVTLTTILPTGYNPSSDPLEIGITWTVGKDCYMIAEGGVPYIAPGENVKINVAATQLEREEDPRTFHADLSLKMNNDDLAVTNGVATFTMPEAAVNVVGTFAEADWFTIETNGNAWMSFYHKWTTTSDATPAAMAANYMVTDHAGEKTIEVKTVSSVNVENGEVETTDLGGVSYYDVPTLFHCAGGLPEKLRFTPNANATNTATTSELFIGVDEPTDMSGKPSIHILSGVGEFIPANSSEEDHILKAHRCYLNVEGGADAPLRIAGEEGLIDIASDVSHADVKFYVSATKPTTAPTGNAVESVEAGQWLILKVTPEHGYWIDNEMLTLQVAGKIEWAQAPMRRAIQQPVNPTALDGNKSDGTGYYYYQIPEDYTNQNGYKTVMVGGEATKKVGSGIRVVRNDTQDEVPNVADLTVNTDGKGKKSLRIDLVTIEAPDDANEKNPVGVTVYIPATLKNYDGTEMPTYGVGSDIIVTDENVPVTDIYMPDTEEMIDVALNAFRLNAQSSVTARIHTSLPLLDDYALTLGLQQEYADGHVMTTVTKTTKFWTLSCGVDLVCPKGVTAYICEPDGNSAVAAVAITSTTAMVENEERVIIKANNGVLMGNADEEGGDYDLVAWPSSDRPSGTPPTTDDAKTYEGNLLVPALIETHFTPSDFYVLYNDQFHELEEDDNTSVSPCKAVLRKGYGAMLSRLRINVFEDATGISDATTDNGQQTTDSWYTLSGVKLDEKPTEKGVYIYNGKKIVIK